jgi:GT2 family glycosyltransferase
VKLSVVLGTLNRRARLEACIESIFTQTGIPFCVYVADAGSTDGTIAYLRSIASDRLVPIFEGRRLGQARAYNNIFEKVDTPYVCWLSDDNVIINRGLDVAARILDENAAIGMVALKVKDICGPWVAAPYIGGVSDIGILNVNQGMLRTSIVRKLGGFNDTFRDYGIDPDLTARVLFTGYAVAYTRPVVIQHYREWGDDASSRNYAARLERLNAYRDLYLQKYGAAVPPSALWNARRRAWRVVRALLRIRPGSTRAMGGLIPRDLENMCASRYISLFDWWTCRGRDHHLVQYCPPRHRPVRLPSDRPALGATSPPPAAGAPKNAV